MNESPPRRRHRVLAACIVGVLSACFVLVHYSQVNVQSDVDQLWAGTRALWRGQDPYSVPLSRIGYPLFYPVTGLLLVSPIAWLPLELFRAVFFGIGAGICVYVLTSRSWWTLTLCTSAAFYYAAQAPQWSPLLTGAALLPWGGFALISKPSLGLVLLLAYPSRTRLLAAGGLTALSFAVRPNWFGSWLQATQTAPHAPLLLVPGGALLLLALLRWRKPEARLIAGLACVPGTGLPYEWVPLWLVGRTSRDYLALALLTDLAFIPILTGPPAWLSVGTYRTWLPVLVLALVYLPSLWMVLRPVERGSDDERAARERS